MKNYYFHDGTGQQGPFDLEQLKTKNIRSDSPIWYEGLQDWKRADEIDELKGILKTKTPPPFEGQPTIPPPLSKPQIQPTTTKNAKSGSKIVLTVIIVILGTIGGFVVLNIIKSPDNNSFLNVTINPPNPRIVAKRGGEDPTSALFNYKAGIDCTILNEGGKGNVLVTCYLYQGDSTYQRSQEIYMTENATEELHFTFDEAERLGKEMKYSIEAKSSK